MVMLFQRPFFCRSFRRTLSVSLGRKESFFERDSFIAAFLTGTYNVSQLKTHRSLRTNLGNSIGKKLKALFLQQNLSTGALPTFKLDNPLL